MNRRFGFVLVAAALAATGMGVLAAPAEAAAHPSCSADGYTPPVNSNWSLTQTDRQGNTFARGHLDIYWSDSQHRVCAMSVSPGGGADSMSVKIRRVGDANWNDQDSGNYHSFAGGVISNAGLGSGDCVRIYGDARYSTTSGPNPAGLYTVDLKVHWNHPGDLC